MIEVVQEVLRPDFILRNSVYISLLLGFLCPFLGVFLVLRRLVFLGIALPQISATGVAFALSIHILAGHNWALLHDANEQTLAFTGSITFTLVAVIVLAILDRKQSGMVEGRLGACYLFAFAASIILLSKCPQAERGWLNLFKGEIIALSNTDLWVTGVSFALIIGVLFIFKKELLFISFDREMALTLGKNVTFWDALLYLLIGLAIAVSVLVVGPLLAFGFLLLPPLIAHRIVRTMRQLAIVSSIIGGVAAFAGFVVAYRLDLPVGPTDIAILGVVYAASFPFRKLLGKPT